MATIPSTKHISVSFVLVTFSPCPRAYSMFTYSQFLIKFCILRIHIPVCHGLLLDLEKTINPIFYLIALYVFETNHRVLWFAGFYLYNIARLDPLQSLSIYSEDILVCWRVMGCVQDWTNKIEEQEFLKILVQKALRVLLGHRETGNSPALAGHQFCFLASLGKQCCGAGKSTDVALK